MKHVTNETIRLLNSRVVPKSVKVIDREGRPLSFNAKCEWATEGNARRSIRADSMFLLTHSPEWRPGLFPDEAERIMNECIDELFEDGHLRFIQA